jgi:hypothetical protein
MDWQQGSSAESKQHGCVDVAFVSVSSCLTAPTVAAMVLSTDSLGGQIVTVAFSMNVLPQALCIR